MAAKILALFALLAVSVSAATAYTTSFPQYFAPSTAVGISVPVPCVQYATLQQVLASGISPSSAIALQRPLTILRQQCWTHIMLQGARSFPQQQAQSILQQQILQQQLLQSLQQQALQQQLQQQQGVWSMFNAVNAINPAAYYGQQQLFPSMLSAFSAVNPLFNTLVATNPAAFWLSTLAATNPAALWQQSFSAGACF